MTSLLVESTPMTLEEFLKFSEGEDNGSHYELDEGELITLPATGYKHGRRVSEINIYLGQHLDRAQYDIVVGETGLIMALDPKPTVRGMDIAVLHKPAEQPQGMLRSAPLLIVEVVSPGNNPLELDKKRKQYQDFGVAELWFVYEDNQTVYVYRKDKPEFFICEAPGIFVSSSLGLTIETKGLFA